MGQSKILYQDSIYFFELSCDLGVCPGMSLSSNLDCTKIYCHCCALAKIIKRGGSWFEDPETIELELLAGVEPFCFWNDSDQHGKNFVSRKYSQFIKVEISDLPLYLHLPNKTQLFLDYLSGKAK